jgi:hypothetical protein
MNRFGGSMAALAIFAFSYGWASPAAAQSCTPATQILQPLPAGVILDGAPIYSPAVAPAQPLAESTPQVYVFASQSAVRADAGAQTPHWKPAPSGSPKRSRRASAVAHGDMLDYRRIVSIPAKTPLGQQAHQLRIAPLTAVPSVEIRPTVPYVTGPLNRNLLFTPQDAAITRTLHPLLTPEIVAQVKIRAIARARSASPAK